MIRAEVYPLLVSGSGLPQLQRHVLLMLDARARAGLAQPTTTDVAGFVGVGSRTARAALVALAGSGWVEESGKPPRWRIVTLHESMSGRGHR